MKSIKDETEERKRSILKYSTAQNVGAEPTRFTRNVIGYVARGEKYIHVDDRFQRISQGDIFFIGQGTHYIENIPSVNDSFEQIVFYYTPMKLQQIIASLDTSNINLDQSPCYRVKSVESTTPSKVTRNFFVSANRHFEYGGYLHNPESERLHLTELILNILTYESSNVKDAVLQCLDLERAEFEKIIYNNLLTDKSVEELASECSRSLTSFKKEFKRIFNMPPHQWYLHQRLNYAKLLLNTTRESISQIGNICAFPNTSHFIKLFKRTFGYTPAVYRSHHNETCGSELEEMQKMQEKETQEVETTIMKK